ncbi:hypothetical protein GOP47_0003529, partial [Adiantum capillus-veneris]
WHPGPGVSKKSAAPCSSGFIDLLWALLRPPPLSFSLSLSLSLSLSTLLHRHADHQRAAALPSFVKIMGMNLFNVKRLFRRRKYERVQVGQAAGQRDDAAAAGTMIGRDHEERIHNNRVEAPRHEEIMMSQGSSSSRPRAAGKSGDQQSWGFKMPAKLVMRRQKSQKSGGSANPHRTNTAVQKFLEGPPDLQAAGQDDIYQQQCRDLLRKLSARGNRVPGLA